jgi:gamma-glutamyl AIG2-like cyclotransferase
MPKPWTFFYGSYMNPGVLREVDIVPERFEVARLAGYDIVIAPRANLVPSPDQCVYGLGAQVTHAELTRLYAHAQDVLGETYLPHAVLVETREGRWLPALCYLAPAMEPRPAELAYVDRIVAPAREHGFPEAYLARLERFRP